MPSEPAKGLFKYSIPDESTSAADRSFYSFPASRLIQDEYHQLNDYRKAENLTKGSGGLDTHGFTYYSHRSKLDGEDWFADNKIEEVYLNEVISLICDVTGANRATIDGVAIRNRLAGDDKQSEEPKGSDLDKAIAKLPRDQIRVTGRPKGTSAKPARICHIDYTVAGLLNTLRWCRTDLRAAAQHILDSEDQHTKPLDKTQSVPRCAVYSVWRPLEIIKRDPLAVLDWQTTDPTELLSFQSRALSAISDTGEYLREGSIALPPKSPSSQKWYWMPNQRPDEVLIIKCADTAAGGDKGIAAGCVHCSPEIGGIDEDAPVRSSVECRVFVFWD